jgi:hypothetical protein
MREVFMCKFAENMKLTHELLLLTWLHVIPV